MRVCACVRACVRARVRVFFFSWFVSVFYWHVVVNTVHCFPLPHRHRQTQGQGEAQGESGADRTDVASRPGDRQTDVASVEARPHPCWLDRPYEASLWGGADQARAEAWDKSCEACLAGTAHRELAEVLDKSYRVCVDSKTGQS